MNTITIEGSFTMEGKVNPFAALLRSRKFWLAVLDAFAGILSLWVGTLVPQEVATRIMTTWVIISGVLAVVIGMIAYEDKARLEAETRKAELAYSAEQRDCCDTAELTKATKAMPVYFHALRDITLLIGLVFAKRDFRYLPISAAMAFFGRTFGYTDLTEPQESAFRAAFANPELQAAVNEVWRVYDEKRASGELPITASPWWS